MVKLRTICRDEKKYTKAKPSDVQKMFRNPVAAAHPLQKVFVLPYLSRLVNINVH